LRETDLLIEQPESGRILPEYIEPNLRELISGNFRVIYRIRKEENTVYIQTVWHVRQDPSKSWGCGNKPLFALTKLIHQNFVSDTF